MRCDNFRLIGDADKTTARLATFFGQFLPEATYWVVVARRSDADAIARGEAVVTHEDWWNGSPLMGTRDPYDARTHAREFRERMAMEREAVGFVNRHRGGDATRFAPAICPPVPGDHDSSFAVDDAARPGGDAAPKMTVRRDEDGRLLFAPADLDP